MSGVVKNPNRGLSRARPITQIPEYKRLGIEPKQGLPYKHMIPNVSSFHDTVSEVDGQIFSDEGEVFLPQTLHTPVRDNNEFVHFDFPLEANIINDVELSQAIDEGNLIDFDEPKPKFTTPSIGEYLLMVNGQLIDTGNKSKIENKVKGILYNEDPEIDNTNDDNDIVILKRVDLQIGVFLKD